MIVKFINIIVFFFLLFNKYICAKVIVKLDANRIIVFNNGINIGLKNKMFFGGQFNPNSIDGASELCKKFQKKEINKNISEIINKIILNLIRFMI